MSKITAAQYPLSFIVPVAASDIGASLDIDVPPGFILTKASLAKRVVFDGTTPAISIVDNKASPTTILASTVLTSTGNAEATTALYTEYPSGGTVSVKPVAGAADVTVGSADVLIQGIVRNRQQERFGASV